MSDDHDAETVAWLHDVVEDTSIELSDLGDEFAPHIVAAVDAITRRVGEAQPTTTDGSAVMTWHAV